MRIVTRPDFDGIVCAALLYDAENITEPVKWIEPSEVQKGIADIRKDDIMANLPYDERCGMWFDHHFSNQTDRPFKGVMKIAPSAAGIIYEYYKDSFQCDYSMLIKQTDRIDSADLTRDEVVHPENHPYLLLSMTTSGLDPSDEPYWNRVVDLLRKADINTILEDPEVKKRCETVIKQNHGYEDLLKKHTKLIKHVAVTDFRPLENTPPGNRFLVFSLFPESAVTMKVRFKNKTRDTIDVSVSHSIFNRTCNVNAGLMLSKFGGGGHRGAGGCSFHADKSEQYIDKMIEILVKNESNEG
jgi:oligoribonuclease NrnB/cAMP/cGMP phosphodiesterase (DHH superfamily)